MMLLCSIPANPNEGSQRAPRMSQAHLTDLVAVHVSWAGRRDLPLASLGVLVHHDCCVVILTQSLLRNPQ